MKHARPRRVRAVLAVAAVLGLGTVATLALWTDSEFAVAPFGATGFQAESATAAAGPYESHDSAGEAAALEFDLPASELEPGQSTASEFWLRMASGSAGSAGSVNVQAPTVERDDLTGRIDVTVAQGACATPGEVLQAGLLEELADAPDAFVLPAGSGDQPGEARPVCITATVNEISDLPAGEYSTGRVGWEFVVTEQEGPEDG